MSLPTDVSLPMFERYDVWFDPMLPDCIALRSTDMTLALRDRLIAEGIEVHQVMALGLHDAVLEVFPQLRLTVEEAQRQGTPLPRPTVRTVARRFEKDGSGALTRH